MVDSELVSYIRQSLNSGYNISTIRQYLINSGYNPVEVDKAINIVTGRISSSEGKSSKFKILFVVATLALIVIIGGLAYVSQVILLEGGTSSPTYYYDIQLSKETYNKGETISITNTFDDFKKASLVKIYFELMDDQGTVVDSFIEDEINVDSDKVVRYNLPPSLSSGTYLIKGAVTFNNKITSSEQSFEITETSSTNNNQINNLDNNLENRYDDYTTNNEYETENNDLTCGDCDDFDFCTEDFCQRSECSHRPIVPCCGNNYCEEGEDYNSCPRDCEDLETENSIITNDMLIERAISATMRNDLNHAGSICEEIDDSKDKDNCFTEVSKASKNSIFCSYVNGNIKRDSCYMSAVMDYKDFSVCEKVEEKYLKKSCESLKILNLAREQQLLILNEPIY